MNKRQERRIQRVRVSHECGRLRHCFKCKQPRPIAGSKKIGGSQGIFICAKCAKPQAKETTVSIVHYCQIGEDQTACGKLTGGRPMNATHHKENVTCAACKENIPIEYRYLNMDTGCITTADRLLKYAAEFPGGLHRVVATNAFDKGPVLTAYGRKQYSHADIEALYKKLSAAQGEQA